MAIDSFKRWEDFGGKVGRHCKDCEERHVGCHSECERYLKAKDEHETYTKRVQRLKEEESILYVHKVKSMQKENLKRRH